MRLALGLVLALASSCGVDGADCTKDSDCWSGICSPGPHTCAPKQCTVDSDCGTSKVCSVGHQAGDVCVTPAQLGDECATSGSDNAFDTGDQSTPCAPGLVCATTHDATAGTFGNCATPGAKGDACNSDSVCASGLRCTGKTSNCADVSVCTCE
jgi:hypothetical protein